MIGSAETTVVEEATIDEPAVPHDDINFTIDETTHVVEVDIKTVSLGRWVKFSYDGAWFLGLTVQKKESPKSGQLSVKVRCFEVPINEIDKPMELEIEGRSIWYKEVYGTKIVPSLVVVERKHLYCI